MATLKVTRTKAELLELLAAPVPATDLIPALSAAAKDPSGLRDSRAVQLVLQSQGALLADAQNNPEITYSVYRDVQRYTDRHIYERPFFERRAKLTAIAMQVLLGNDDYLGLLHDYAWSVCEETIWIVPQREDLTVDLRTADTSISLAELVVALEHKLEPRLVERVRKEIDRRAFTDYLANHGKRELLWWKGRNNWNGVCNGGIGAAFLLLEPNLDRLATALEIVLEGLQTFVDVAFAEDGTSEEGMGYWQYGLTNYCAFAEMLRIRTGGQLDLLDNDRMREIAHFPMSVVLSPGRFFAYSDCDEETALLPGLITRIAERTGVAELNDLLAEPASLARGARHWHTAWRSALWWDGIRPPRPTLKDSLLASTGTARLVSQTPTGAEVVLGAKAGHNGVPHNHNDVGSFVVHVDSETLLVDPERGLYDLYLIHGHDNVIFSNSFGHSCPVIDGTLQSKGEQFAGQVTRFEPDGPTKVVAMEIQGAYEVKGLEKAERTFAVTDGEIMLTDAFSFANGALPVEEAFITWNQALVQDNEAYVVGDTHLVRLTIEEPAGATFKLTVHQKESDENKSPVPLKRLSFQVPASGKATTARVRITVLG
jgi:hypothetical protein